MKKPATRRAVGLLVSLNITGEREYSYKMPFFPQTLIGMGKRKPAEWVAWRVVGYCERLYWLVRDDPELHFAE
jgi:hypothetical protein